MQPSIRTDARSVLAREGGTNARLYTVGVPALQPGLSGSQQPTGFHNCVAKPAPRVNSLMGPLDFKGDRFAASLW